MWAGICRSLGKRAFSQGLWISTSMGLRHICETQGVSSAECASTFFTHRRASRCWSPIWRTIWKHLRIYSNPESHAEFLEVRTPWRWPQAAITDSQSLWSDQSYLLTSSAKRQCKKFDQPSCTHILYILHVLSAITIREITRSHFKSISIYIYI